MSMNKSIRALADVSIVLVAMLLHDGAVAFAPETKFAAPRATQSALNAKPRRLEENVEGALYVNDRVSLSFVKQMNL